MSRVAATKHDRHLLFEHLLHDLVLLLLRHLFDLVEGPIEAFVIFATLVPFSTVFASVVLFAKVTFVLLLAIETLELMHDVLFEEHTPDSEQRGQDKEDD